MWQALKALWAKIAGQAPPVPPTSSTRKPVPSPSPQPKQPPAKDLSTRATTPVPRPDPKAATSGRDRDPLSTLDAVSTKTPTAPDKAWDAFSAMSATADKKESTGLESGKPAEDATDDFMQMLVGKRPAPTAETAPPEPQAPEEKAVPEPISESPDSSEITSDISPPTGEAPKMVSGFSEPGVIPPVQPAEKPTDSPTGEAFPKAVQSPILPARPTPTAESINSFGAKSNIGSRISSIASSTSSDRAVSSISTARLRQPEYAPTGIKHKDKAKGSSLWLQKNSRQKQAHPHLENTYLMSMRNRPFFNL
ncbi:hypothetical protein [Thermostichus vulcanus]|uniref:Uncharacterized protein n=1 Tax=Thermostichus vulcanus str. 'Rupite' TaxID=2813851 RepID=A0ABT0C6U4_THEVL|nr:hypothetical protein [Thermostichus vulcanus]MCJ2541517.1 hypothetical protein [Thermostichus vulcanus str. 'Rupite']